MPVSPVPAWPLIIVRSLAPIAISAWINRMGMPAVPKSPIMLRLPCLPFPVASERAGGMKPRLAR